MVQFDISYLYQHLFIVSYFDKCLHLKESSGSCGKETVMNDADAANTTRIEAVKKAVESAEDGANYRVKSGSLKFYSLEMRFLNEYATLKVNRLKY